MKKAGAFLLALVLTVLGFGQTGTNVVISQVYGGGGNSGSVYTHDFIELFNPTASPISINGWSVQYTSATGSGTWQVTNLTNFTLQPGQYYLIQQAQGSGGTTALPAPNATGAIAMSGTAGKVALVNNTTALTGACPAGLIDLVGFGVTANCFEGTGATPPPSNTNSIMRALNGCKDANDNNADFAAVTAAPRNSSSPFNVCGGGGTPTLTVTGTINDFGTVTLGNSSASQSIIVSGTNLTPGSGNINAGILPLPHFSVSLDNVNFFSSVSLPYTGGTLAATTVYVKYNPGLTGIHVSSLVISGGGVASAANIGLTGNCIPSPTPTLSAGGPNPFPPTCINT
ncbi:MAG: lamin tail domain-containing protein, partial [Dinghuibacter sp.]|nr:lamin tail domain-containing protein [Dinghuibacter sp.]